MREEGASAAPDVEHRGLLAESHEALHQRELVPVVLAHRPFVERRKQAPVGLLAMGDVLVVVVDANSFSLDPRLLVGEAAAVAGHEPEPARLSGEVVLRLDER